MDINYGTIKGLPTLEVTPLKLKTASWSYQVATGRKKSYEGTVPAQVVAERRKTAKAAKQARKLHRGNR